MNTGDSRKKSILILGMHRSGTSALTRVVNLLGAEVGADLLPAAADNPSGFWEHRGIVSIHDQLLRSFGRSWHDLRAMPQGWLESAAADMAREQLTALLTTEFADTALWAVKDPRLCRLLPLWHRVLAELHVEAHAVLVLRHPDEVSASLLARDGIAVEYTRLSWLQHMAEAELGSRGFSRSVISYDNLLLDWSSCMKRLSEDMLMEWPVPTELASAEVSKFLNAGARNHDARSASGRLPQTIELVYKVLLSKANQQEKTWQTIEAATDSYRTSAEVFIDAIDAVSASLSSAQTQIDHKTVEYARLSSRLDGLFRSIEENNTRTYLHNGPTDSGLLKDVAKIYWRRADETYAEERSVSVTHGGMRELTGLRFEIPEGCLADFIRFDPSEFPGEFRINAVHVGGVSITDFDRGLSANGSHIVSSIAGELRIASVDTDPNIELDVSKLGLAMDRAVAIELSCCRITPYGELRDLIESALLMQKAEVANSVTALLEKPFRTNVDRLDALADQLVFSERARIDGHQELERKVSEFAEKLDNIRKSQQQSDSNLNMLTERLDEFAKIATENVAQFRDAEAKHASALEKSALETSTNLETVQRRQDQVEAGVKVVANQVKELATVCTDNFGQSRSAEAQQILETADLKMRLDAILTHQQRTFMDRFRRKKLRSL
jgi:hypothetical protein